MREISLPGARLGRPAKAVLCATPLFACAMALAVGERHDGAQRAHQSRRHRAQIGDSLFSHFRQDGVASRREANEHAAAIVFGALAADQAAALETVDQTDGAVMAHLQPLGQHANGWLAPRGQSAQREQQKILLWLKTRRARSLIRLLQVADDAIAEFRQLLIGFQNDRLSHARIVSRNDINGSARRAIDNAAAGASKSFLGIEKQRDRAVANEFHFHVRLKDTRLHRDAQRAKSRDKFFIQTSR
jgi:hypothetical protein